MNKDELVGEINGLTKVYGEGATSVVAVDNVSLHLEKGEVVLIMGPSGSGKTTLLQMIGGLSKPTSGNIKINKTDITQLSRSDMTKFRLNNLGFVFQKPNLLASLTAVQNITIVKNLSGTKDKESKASAISALKKLGLGERLGHRPGELSGGEQQRVSIARALINDPDIILADEPTANLDSKSGANVIQLLRNAAKEEQRSVVIVSHDLRIRKYADRVLWLEDGKLRHRWSENINVDPVCLMAVDITKSSHYSVVNNKKHWFCSSGCKEKFDGEPEKWIG